MSAQDEPITYRERAIIEATAKAVMDKLTETYKPDQYGTNAFKETLTDFFGNMTADVHIRHHDWVSHASMGARQDISWADFWYSLAKGAAAVVFGFIGLAVLWAVITYLRAGAPGVTH